MTLQEFIIQKQFDIIESELKNVKKQFIENNFNLFTISSVNSYLENYHSDIIAFLLNSKKEHNHDNHFLFLFIDYLNSLGFKISKLDYENAEITREKGRIDIWIKDSNSKKSLIIENKINDAIDQQNQLENYYSYSVNSGYEVDVIIYLTLNGFKRAPITDIQLLDDKVLNIPAYSNVSNDLTNGWLIKCHETSKTEDSSSFLYQYIKLLKHLSRIGMDRKVKDEFYKIVGSQNGFERVQTIVELTNGLLEYRATIFAEQINNDYAPFKKIYRWRPNHWLFEQFKDGDNDFKLDVHFLSNGSARIDFWNPGKEEEVQTISTSEKLKSIGLYNEFEHGGFGGGMFKVINNNESTNIMDVDSNLFQFVKLLFEKLR